MCSIKITEKNHERERHKIQETGNTTQKQGKRNIRMMIKVDPKTYSEPKQQQVQIKTGKKSPEGISS